MDVCGLSATGSNTVRPLIDRQSERSRGAHDRAVRQFSDSLSRERLFRSQNDGPISLKVRRVPQDWYVVGGLDFLRHRWALFAGGGVGHGPRGDPDRIRTCDLRIRNPSLYPAELRGPHPKRPIATRRQLPSQLPSYWINSDICLRVAARRLGTPPRSF